MSRESGTSLLEVLISMALGLILLGLTMDSWLGSRRLLQQMQVRLDALDRSRFGLLEMRHWLQLAGFRPWSEDMSRKAPQALWPADRHFPAGAVIKGDRYRGRELVRLRFVPESGVRDCKAELPRPGRIRSFSLYLDQQGALRCAEVGGADPVSLVEGVAELSFDYGLGTVSGRGVSQYLPASQLESSQWRQLRAVRVRLRLQGALRTQVLTVPLPRWRDWQE